LIGGRRPASALVIGRAPPRRCRSRVAQPQQQPAAQQRRGGPGGEHADPFTNTVTVGRLRRKLGNPPIIITTPGVGYRITDPLG
jgi:hypothetical protein